MPLLRSLRSLLLVAALPLGAQSADLPRIIAQARAAAPPVLPQPRRAPDLVDVTRLDPSLCLDIRNATADNFLHAQVYTQAKAFLQRPAAEALVRVNRDLKARGYVLRIHDAYRPWWVTKVFWDATPPASRAYVADPARGSIHNRGCAVDLDLVNLADGQLVSMPGDYDEMSQRSHQDYQGGPAEARQHRDLLRTAMEAQGFKALAEEWWHYDHASSPEYGVLNLAFEAIGGH